MSTTFSKAEYESFLQYLNGTNPFMVVSGYLYNCIDQSKSPISQDSVRLRVLIQAFNQMSFVLPEEVKISMRIGQIGKNDPSAKFEYLAEALGVAFYWWPGILRGTVNTLFEIYDDLVVLNEEKLFEDLEEYITSFEIIHKEYFKNNQ